VLGGVTNGEAGAGGAEGAGLGIMTDAGAGDMVAAPPHGCVDALQEPVLFSIHCTCGPSLLTG
jgi:hypothetical protein